jgi:hypothetical protein
MSFYVWLEYLPDLSKILLLNFCQQLLPEGLGGHARLAADDSSRVL